MIRAYERRDEEQLLDVWYRASLAAHSFLSSDFLQGERVEIADQWLPAAETVVYESDGRVVGFLSLIGNEVGAIFVDPDLHGRGIGTALMDDARGRRPILELSVFEENWLGRRFYERYGFRTVGRTTDERTGHEQLRLRLG